MKYLFLFLFGSLLLINCTNPADTTTAHSYFDLKGFIEKQTTELNKRRPLVNKEMTLGDQNEKTQTNDIDWQRELELFNQADLNKQAYQLSYTISQPNATTYLYVLKSGENLPVKTLKIEVDEISKQPKLIEALMEEQNRLYDSEKRLQLTCTLRPEGVWLVKTYEISGFQHLSITDRKTFSVKGTIN
ncbi:hypothetical protein [Runella slithyformis]|uniref:Uncharacterized protein n=1 Tax=Runella slithyformis (strain ATCC 29530 / DSM 19594 / LMG 11500 / NCIMB 11436 / LSU 4) TaxID=761193 RepID=A0A7U3ZPA3_RUNSL|nr:hypothetical protein [Runella slithyformis]AEI50866.1 hypothetical protein Runsl_4545 [Runella slithyformis DSM 19594]